MGKGFVLGFAAAIATFAAACCLFVMTGGVPAGQDVKPGRLEKWVARASLRATMRREARGLTSPLQATDDDLTAGVALYRAHCEVCHGGSDGVASSIARGLSPDAPQLAKDGVEDDPEGVIYWKIAHGIRFTGMPGFSNSLSSLDMWRISLFAKHMDALPAGPRAKWLSDHASH